MKLVDITEVQIVPGSQPAGIDLSPFKNGEVIGTAEGGLPLRKYTQQALTIFSIDDRSYVMGRVIAAPSGMKNSQTLIIERSFTPPEHQRQGLSTALYAALSANGYNLLSDSQLSDVSFKVWRTLAATGHKVRAYNVDTHALEDITDWSQVANNADIRLVLEEFDPHTLSGGLIGEGTVTRSGVIPLPLRYTHPSNNGAFE